MKKILSMLVIFVLVLGISGCSKMEASKSEEDITDMTRMFENVTPEQMSEAVEGLKEKYPEMYCRECDAYVGTIVYSFTGDTNGQEVLCPECGVGIEKTIWESKMFEGIGEVDPVMFEKFVSSN